MNSVRKEKPIEDDRETWGKLRILRGKWYLASDTTLPVSVLISLDTTVFLKAL